MAERDDHRYRDMAPAEVVFIEGERIEDSVYHEFLSRTDLGEQYPAEGMESRIHTLLARATLTVQAQTRSGQLVGVCLGLTDYAYFLFVSDLGVDRRWTGRGLGRALLARCLRAAGGAPQITMVATTNRQARGFYRKLGWVPGEHLMWRPTGA